MSLAFIKGFTASSRKKRFALIPTEDSFSIDADELIFAAADGVTRDPTEVLPDTGTLKGKMKFALSYPKVSPATIAADIFTYTFPEVLSDYDTQNRNERAIRAAFEEANERIGDWNSMHMPDADYLLRDFAGCVASGASLHKGIVSLGFLADSGAAIFDEKGNLRFRTENQGPEKHDKFIWQDERLKNLGWRNPEARRIIRKHYRNNPSEEHSFGVLTGEEAAMHYVKTGSQEIKPGEHLFVYTDGLEHIIFSGEFADRLRQNDFKGMERLCRQKVRTEGTLVHYAGTGKVHAAESREMKSSEEGFTAEEQDEILYELRWRGFDCRKYLTTTGRLEMLCTGRIEVVGDKYGWGMLPVIEIEKQKQEGVVSYTLTWIPPVYRIDGEIFDNKIVISGIKPGEMGKTLDRLLGDIDLIPRRQLPLYDIKS